MASTINASTSAGLVSTADTSGVLQLQTAGTAAVTIDAAQAVTFSAGTANGVAYLNGSKVLTTGSALTFDGNYFTAVSGTGSFLADILQVSGSATKVNANGVGLEFRGSITPNITAYNRVTSAYLPMTLDTSASIFSISGSERMRLDSSGNLLVGTTSATTLTTNSIVARATQGSLYVAHENGNTGSNFGVFVYDGTTIGSISQSGTTAVLYNVTSDQRLKENIVDAPEFGSVIDSIKVRSYDWKADGNHQRAGFIAQELVTVAPEAVHQPADPEEMMAVDYSKLVPMLVKEIQSLRIRIAQLEAK